MKRYLTLTCVRQFVIATLSAFTVLLLGCTSTGGLIGGFQQVVQDPQTYYITNAAGDSCARFRKPFVQVRVDQRRTVAKWAALGAAAGTAGGAALDKKNRARGALIGLFSGIIVGAAAGYYADLQERTSSTQALRNTVFSDAKRDVRSSDKLVQAVTRLNRCRVTAIQAVASDVRGKKITKEDARKRLADIQRSTIIDDQLIGSVAQGLTQRTNTYVTALRKSGADNPDAYITKAASYKPVVVKPRYTVSRSKNPRGVTVKTRNRRSENTVTSAAKNGSELKALQVAHQETIEENIKDVETMLL